MKKISISLLVLLSTVVLVACNNGDDTKGKTDETSKVEQSNTKEKDVKDDKKTQVKQSDHMFKDLRSKVKDKMSAKTMTPIFIDTEPKVIDRQKTVVSINGFELDEVTDFHSDFEIPFDGQTDKGGIVLAEFTIENKSKEPIYYTPDISLTFTGSKKAYSSTQSLQTDESKDFSTIITRKNFKIEAGEKITGNAAYAIDLEGFEKIKKEGIITAEVLAAFSKEDSFQREDMIGEDELVQLATNKESAVKIKATEKLYKDKVTLENWGEKTLLAENSAVNKTEKIGKTTVNMEGYQFTEFKPNEEQAPRFSNYENGIVLLTAKFKVENQADYDISLSSASSTLVVNNGSQKTLNESMLVNSPASDQLKHGKSGEFIQVFVLDKEQYEKIWKDKSFGMEVKFRDYDTFENIENGKSATFEWKNK